MDRTVQEIIFGELRERSWSVADLANAMDATYDLVYQILECDRPVTVLTDAKLRSVFVSPYGDNGPDRSVVRIYTVGFFYLRDRKTRAERALDEKNKSGEEDRLDMKDVFDPYQED